MKTDLKGIFQDHKASSIDMAQLLIQGVPRTKPVYLTVFKALKSRIILIILICIMKDLLMFYSLLCFEWLMWIVEYF